MSDFDDISQLVGRFDDAVNRRDVSEFHALWLPEGVWEIGDPFPLRVEGVERISSTWKRMVDRMVWMFRGSFAGVVTVSGEHAVGRWPCVETGTFVDGRGYDNRAIYEDRYERVDGRWYLAYRKYLYLWLSQDKLPGAPVPLGSEIAAE